VEQDFRLGSLVVRPSLNSIALDGTTTRLEPKVMAVLVCLAEHAGSVVTKEQLIGAVWPDTFVGDDVLTRCVSELRRALDDDPRAPRMIETIPKRGYRVLGRVELLGQQHRGLVERLASWFGNLRRKGEFRGNRVILLAFIMLTLGAGLVSAFPWIARYYNNRGLQLQGQGQLEAAIQAYRRALSLKSSYASAHYNLGDAYEDIPNYEKALDEYQRAIDADLMFYPAYINLSRLYILRRRDYGAALSLLDHALSLKPQEPAIQYSLYKNYGWANLELGQLGQAEQNLRLAMGLDPRRSSAHCLLAKVLDKFGRPNDALPQWESCLAFSNQPEVEPEWRNEAQEHLRQTQEHPTGGPK
jgi:DNA-binding winged helix-turn-helix (wHTH) protein/Flp pilus assembly protein TadD